MPRPNEMTDVAGNARDLIVGEISHRSAVSRFLLVLSVLIFAIGSVLPDAWSPLAMSPSGDAIVETVLVDASGDGDAFAEALTTAAHNSRAQFVVTIEKHEAGWTFARHELSGEHSFDARGPPGA